MSIKPEYVTPLYEYPRPMFQRESYKCLNGTWNADIFKTDDRQKILKNQIKVPYPLESRYSIFHSSIKKNEYLHIKKDFVLEKRDLKGRVILNIGAVDQRARIYINGKLVMQWTFPYVPLQLDITDHVKLGENELYLVIMDDPENEFYERGVQTNHPTKTWHKSVTGIWQTVFLEFVAESYVKNLKIDTNYDAGLVTFSINTFGKLDKIYLDIFDGDNKIVTLTFKDNVASYRFANFTPWDTENPFLYTVLIHTKHEKIKSYFGMRKISKTVIGDKQILMLNNKPFLLQGVISKGYYGDGLYTPYNYDLFKKDILAAKNLGFNTIRMFMKIEAPLFYYYADKLGMLIYQDFPNGGEKYFRYLIEDPLKLKLEDSNHALFGRSSTKSQDHFINSMIFSAKNLYNHPSIIAWTIFNEGWGQFDAKKVTMALKGIDSSRIIDSTSGWFDQNAGDVNSVHQRKRNFRLYNDYNRLLILTKCGDISLFLEEYSSLKKEHGKVAAFTKDELNDEIKHLLRFIIKPAIINEGLTGYFYHQLTDIDHEISGLLTFDRKYIKCDYKLMIGLNKELKQAFEDIYIKY